jgi:hypothetical protein
LRRLDHPVGGIEWLRVQYTVEKPSMKLQATTELDSDAFVAEVRRIRGKKNPLSVAALKNLRDEFDAIDAAVRRARERLQSNPEFAVRLEALGRERALI